MTCKEIADRVTDYYDSALSSSEAREIETHLESCERCRMHFERMRQLISAMGKLPETSNLAAKTRAQIMEEFREYHSQRRLFGFRRGWAFTAAGVIAIAVLAIVVWIVRTHTERPTELRAATLDLTDRGPLRGTEEQPPKPPLQLVRGNFNLTVCLPVGSEPGVYEIQVVSEQGQSVWAGEGDARLESHTTTLHLKVDLSDSKPGQYSLGVRPKGWEWTYFPLVVK